MSPVAQPVDCDIIGQFEYLSTVTRQCRPRCTKKSEHTAWKGQTTGIGGMGGAPGCEGAIRWQMSTDMHDQNTEDSAREVIIDTPWWAACMVLNISPRSEGGKITLSLSRIYPSVDVVFSRYWWSRIVSGISIFESRMPSVAISSGVCISTSLLVASLTRSYVNDRND